MNEQDPNNFDNQLKSKLGSMKFDPPSGLKNKLASDFDAIAAKRRRRWFILWFSSGFAVLLLLGAGLGAFYYSSNTNNAISHSDSLASAIVPRNQDFNDQEFSDLEENLAPEASSTEQKTNNSNGTIESSSFAPSDVSEYKGVNTDNQTNTKAKVASAKVNTIDKGSEQTGFFNEREKSETNNTRINTDLIVASSGSVNPLNGEVLGDDNVHNEEDGSADKAKREQKEDSPYSKTEVVPTEKHLAKSLAPSLKLLPTLNLALTSTSTIADRNREVTYKALPPMLPSAQNCLRPFVTVGAGTGLSYRVLKSDAHADVVEHKNQNEHSALSYSGQIAASFPLFKSYAIKGGFHYLRLAEAYHFAAGAAEHQTVNTYDYFNLDLKLTKNLFCDGKFRVDLSAGAKLGNLVSAQSSWLDPNDHSPILHSSTDQQNPFSKYALSWNAELAGYYTFGKDWIIGLGLEGDYFQNSVYIKQTGLVQRPYFFQGSLVFGKTF